MKGRDERDEMRGKEREREIRVRNNKVRERDDGGRDDRERKQEMTGNILCRAALHTCWKSATFSSVYLTRYACS